MCLKLLLLPKLLKDNTFSYLRYKRRLQIINFNLENFSFQLDLNDHRQISLSEVNSYGIILIY